MSWIVAGADRRPGSLLTDWLMWGKVFTGA